MPPDRKTRASIPLMGAALCLAIVLIIVTFSFTGEGCRNIPGSPAAQCTCRETSPAVLQAPLVVPALCPVFTPSEMAGPAVSEHLVSADLVLARPPAEDRVPYTARNFSRGTEAAVAWWMSPGFMDNTSEFRRYLRDTPAGRASYPEEHRVFFNFIGSALDDAEQQSVIKNDIVLFRGIGSGLATSILDNAEYNEPSFASTSYDITLSLDAFGPRGTADMYRNMIVLERQSGDHALYVNEDQREFLLPRGTAWHVIRAIEVENLTVQADFPLHNRTVSTTSFDHVRLIYVAETTCT
jgi:hypothetical protein